MYMVLKVVDFHAAFPLYCHLAFSDVLWQHCYIPGKLFKKKRSAKNYSRSAWKKAEAAMADIINLFPAFLTLPSFLAYCHIMQI